MSYLAQYGGFCWAIFSIMALTGGPMFGLIAPFNLKPRWLGVLMLPAGFALGAGGAVSLGYATAYVEGFR